MLYFFLNDIRGNRIPIFQKTDLIRKKFFEKSIIITSPTDSLCQNIFNETFPFNIDPISSIEIQQIISKLKSNKAVGPHGAITELFKWLNSTGFEIFIKYIFFLGKMKNLR